MPWLYLRMIAALAATLSGLTVARGQECLPAPSPPAAPPVLSLAELIPMALAQQPNLAALRKGLESAEINVRGLDSRTIRNCIASDWPIRRQQAVLGVELAAVRISLMEQETVYGVTYTYLAMLHARRQLTAADEAAERARRGLDLARKLVGNPLAPRDLTADALLRAEVQVRQVMLRRGEAQRGLAVAAAALQEALGSAFDCPPLPADDRIPDHDTAYCRDEIIRMALNQRPELRLAHIFVQLTALEIEAQARHHLSTVPTFLSKVPLPGMVTYHGSGSDQYRPPYVVPEMPVSLSGKREYRVARAQVMHERALAVEEKFRNLIALEAEDAFRRWEEAAARLRETREAFRLTEPWALRLSGDLKALAGRSFRDLIEEQLLAATARVQYQDAIFDHAVAIARLEKVTAGGVCFAAWFVALPEQPGTTKTAAAPGVP